MRIASHIPTLGETIAFPVDSVQHRLIILTLVTHILLSVPVFHSPLRFWRTIRHPNAHHQTIGIILATLALKWYHPIWFTHPVPFYHLASPSLGCHQTPIQDPSHASLRFPGSPPHQPPTRSQPHHSLAPITAHTPATPQRTIRKIRLRASDPP